MKCVYFYVLFLVVLHNMWICMWITMWIMFRYCYMYYCIIILIQKSALIVQIQNKTFVRLSVKWEKTDVLVCGGWQKLIWIICFAAPAIAESSTHQLNFKALQKILEKFTLSQLLTPKSNIAINIAKTH